MKSGNKEIEAITGAVLEKSKYQNISEDLLRMIAQMELSKGRTYREAVKEVSARLHQVAAGFFKKKPRYTEWIKNFQQLPCDLNHEAVRVLCKKIMQQHSSTAERLPILDEFFYQVLDEVQPITSILDLACGLNPLAMSWMPLNQETTYFGCDIFHDLTDFLNSFSKTFGVKGGFEPCNLLNPAFGKIPLIETQVTFILKTLPCLAQLDKNAALNLIEKIPSQYVLVSYPVASLGGRPKGMPQNYENQFWELVSTKKSWQIRTFNFQTELAFLIRK